MSLRGKVAAVLAGALIEDVVRREHSWEFVTEQGGLGVECNWRLIDGGALVLTDADDGQQYGLPAPIDAEAEAKRRLLGRRIVEARVEPATGDLKMLIEGGAMLELISTSVGYESWQLYQPSAVIVAKGGLVSEAREVQPGMLIGGPWE